MTLPQYIQDGADLLEQRHNERTSGMGTELAEKQEVMRVHEAAQAPVPADPAIGLMDVISRAASDPNVDVEKMRALLDMRRDLERDDNAKRFNEAMSAVQKAVRPIAADAANPQTRSKYASYPALDKVLRPIYTQHGFALSFDTGDAPQESYVRVVCHVSCEGHTRTYHVDMPADGKGAKGGDVMTKTHAVGSAMSYGMRYLLKMIFNVAVGEDDDDGNAAGAGPKVTDEQRAKLRELADEVGADVEKFCKYMRVESLADIPAAQFQRALDALEAKRGKAQ
ncbi:ERF family protein [Methyloceanibacter caenitepidi]|uniref:Phage related protein n=1 Tax=Methyloceanibacter caenitepidi TaxID=1384459 RepID=A0A0A8K5Y8_9HYPH|nr:ERF family protein [Methyloceanibacter caenitepidi]BAQ18353.1 phage related protein [Methyloceanibacter caenitepidi]